jgi:FtsP/CotA-like multicopper oxidase with cupredoxin domain
MRKFWSLLGLCIWLSAVAEAQGQVCPDVKEKQELKPIGEIPAVAGKLDTTFKIELKEHCIPIRKKPNGDWEAARMTLRTYGYPDPKNAGQWIWSIPGPTLRVSRPATPAATGDSIRVKLINNLPPKTDSECSPPCQGTVDCKQPNPPGCCQARVEMPNCFHGLNTTNLHFHGTHVSPQPPQDYVLLELRPCRETPASPCVIPPASSHPAHSRGEVVYGDYQYAVEPLPANQPEGTHWYHPHKHGSVADQLTNGMAGALVIRGPFDDWLNSFYGGNLKEQLLVVQQLRQAAPFFTNAGAPPLLVNGQPNPQVPIKLGEIQRWRFVSATMQSSAQVEIQFPKTHFEVRQIAMDGIQFAPENYEYQPLFDLNTYKIQLSPGNRADFLVKLIKALPDAEGLGGPVDLEVTHKVFGELEEDAEKAVREMEEARAPGAAEASLFTVAIEEPPQGAEADFAEMQFPKKEEWPKMPDFLRDIEDKEIQGSQDLTFSMLNGTRTPLNRFYINEKQFDPACVDITTKLGAAEEWTIRNASTPRHPFHIHTNPFQVTSNSEPLKPIKAPYMAGHDRAPSHQDRRAFESRDPTAL